MSENPRPIPRGVGGWLLVLCALLLVWHPLNFAGVAAGALQALPLRGTPLALVLAARLLVTAVGIAAGIALLARRPAAVTLAVAALALSAAADLFVYTTSYMPSNRLPGDTMGYVAMSLLYHGAWLLYLVRSTRVRNTY
jgi:Protein of unknown function (DUF2569)